MDIDLDKAYALADRVHYRQLDKAGRPYIEHCERVAGRVVGNYTKALALLHDTIEDDYESEDLGADIRAIGGEQLLNDVVMLTRKEDETYNQYIERIAKEGSVDAVMVKLLDNLDNSSESRLALLSSEDRNRLSVKYHTARIVLMNRIRSDIEELTSAVF